MPVNIASIIFEKKFLEKPEVAIVILNYNGRSFLEKFLPSVIASTYSANKIYVADNASTDDSVEFLQNHYPQIQLIRLEKNYGYAGGYNLALQNLEEPYFILLNSDIEVEPGWIEPVIELMETDKKIASCQPKILSYKDKSMFEYAGAAGGWIDVLGYPFARGRVFETCEKDLGQYNDVAEVFWASGAAMFIRSEIFKQLGGLNAHFFAHMEEIELCWRIHLTRLKVAYCPQSIVYHVGGGTLPKGNSRKVFLNFRNNLWMLFIHLPLEEKVWKLPIRFLLDMLFAMKSLLSGHFGDSWSVFMAWIKVVFTPLPIQGKTMPLRKKMISIPGVYNGSLLWEYYAHGKKFFSKIVKKKL